MPDARAEDDVVRDVETPSEYVRCAICDYAVYKAEVSPGGICGACIAASYAATDEDLRRFIKEDWRAQ